MSCITAKTACAKTGIPAYCSQCASRPTQVEGVILPHALDRVGGRAESPGNSGRWLIISAKMQPMDHTSTGVE